MYAHAHSHRHTLAVLDALLGAWWLTDSSVGWGGGCSLTQWGRFEVWSHFLRRHTHTCTHRLFSAWFEGSEAPGDDDGVGVDGRRTLECTPQTNICPVDCLHIPRCVYTHPADPQHACNIRIYGTAAEFTSKAECRAYRAKSITT